jgi:secreted trypsin-like serine protease
MLGLRLGKEPTGFKWYLVTVVLLALQSKSTLACSKARNSLRSASRSEILEVQDVIEGEFPFLVSIDGDYCTGAIIDQFHILTAAHCLDNY